ncbi:hypothetical protein RhiirA4_460942 [Rhizophagus irregularis]|uniref:Uncharacterized protein n=1 Tax=Rhizophagus irregularis TaxID=588596 RepID=A0A2I1GHN5_9GLOM|nr:hypothetical protein RhiirA4_460942 [Rhizophagus irregularis]
MGRTMIDEVINSQKYKEKYEILEKEIYKLFVKNCKNITEFYWQTTLPLCQCPGASTFFSQLHTLKIDYLIPIKLFEMAEYCQNTKNLGIWNCDDIPGLIKFYLFTEYLPRHEVCMLIEKSHGNIKTMKIWNYQDFEYTKGLFKAIAKNRPNFECLYINIQFEDLNGIKEILLGCTILNKLHLYINDEIEEEEDNCDEILNILADCSPKTFNFFQ